jgi:hypothetical protein
MDKTNMEPKHLAKIIDGTVTFTPEGYEYFKKQNQIRREAEAANSEDQATENRRLDNANKKAGSDK